METKWRFYGREAELGALLARMRRKQWFFGAVRGRRRIGKTALLQQALATLAQDESTKLKPFYTQFVAENTDSAIQRFRIAVDEAGLAAVAGGSSSITSLPDMAVAIRKLCLGGVFVVIDEFQRCLRGPLEPFPALLQQEVDRLQNTQGGGLVVLGSVQTEMEFLLADQRAPLFGRVDYSLDLPPWDLRTIFEVCAEHGATDAHRCLTLYTLMGGVPKYWKIFAELINVVDDIWPRWAASVCNSLFLREESPLREEGARLLDRELRQNYISVLSTVARLGTCTGPELRGALQHLPSASNYLRSLVKDLRLVEMQMPILGTASTRRARYRIADPFLSAWLGAIETACVQARITPSDQVATKLLPRLQSLEGMAFERMVRQATEEASRYGCDDFPVSQLVHGYWNKPVSRAAPIEIDLVAWNDHTKSVRFGSCKRNAAKHDRAARRSFRLHVERFLETREGRRFREWNQEFALFAPRFPVDQRRRLESDGWVCRDLIDFRAMLGRNGNGATGAFQSCTQVRGEP